MLILGSQKQSVLCSAGKSGLDNMFFPFKHLGNKLESDISMQQDIAWKKANFIGKMNSLSQEFHFVSPDVLLNIINIYGTSFHGSGLWDLFSKNSDRLNKSP